MKLGKKVPFEEWEKVPEMANHMKKWFRGKWLKAILRHQVVIYLIDFWITKEFQSTKSLEECNFWSNVEPSILIWNFMALKAIFDTVAIR